MSVDRYQCCDPGRRAALNAAGVPANLSGIDYIEVRQGAKLSDPSQIDIFLVKPLPRAVAVVTVAMIRLTGGVRFAPPQVQDPAATLPAAGPVTGWRLTLPGGQPTDFSTYSLAIVAGAGDAAPPAFLDPRLAQVDFSFKVDCPSDFDCAPDCAEPPAVAGDDPVSDYTTRDWPGFRAQMLDRMRALVPGFIEDDPSDLTTTLIEALAFRADQQSYRLDALATEAFLATARSPISLRRLTRLVDYRPGEGASARVAVSFDFTPGGGAAEGMVLAKSTPLLTQTAAPPGALQAADYLRLLTPLPVVFETMAPLALWSWRNRIAVYTWKDSLCRLEAGATALTLLDGGAGGGGLQAGDLLVLEEIASPETGLAADADPVRRHVVRLTAVTPTHDPLYPVNPAQPLGPFVPLVTVTWAAADAMPFDLVLSARPDGASAASAPVVTAAVRGNVTLADHGASLPPVEALGLLPAETAALRPRLSPAAPLSDRPWRPVLDRTTPARTAPADFSGPPFAPATALLSVDARECLPVVNLQDDFSTWTARADLLGSDAFDRGFVVETGLSGKAELRFGNGIEGAAPEVGSVLLPWGRFGAGPGGNLGAGALAHVVLPLSQNGAILRPDNPLAAAGGAAPEPASTIRRTAPEAFRVQDRAVTAQDYAEAAMRHPEVGNALALPRWTGAWQTMLVYLDRKGGVAVDAGFTAEIAIWLEHFRLIGFDVAVRPARPAPLDIAMTVCAAPDRLRAQVGRDVRAALRPNGPGDGTLGFFHPDRFTFGAALYLSALTEAVMAVPGVESLRVTTFQRFGRIAQGELAAGILRPAEAEILQLADDPSFPERGRLTLTMGGGR